MYQLWIHTISFLLGHFFCVLFVSCFYGADLELVHQ